MLRLIDANALEAEFAGPFVQTYKDCREALREAPAIDAEPVRHGRWIKEQLCGCEPYYICSKCGKLHYQDYNFCNNCGAKIDGGAET